MSHQSYQKVRGRKKQKVGKNPKDSKSLNCSQIESIMKIVFIETEFESHTFLQISIHLLLVKKTKIAPGVCPGTQHTSPLIPIGGEPTYYHGIPRSVLGLVAGVPGAENGC